MGLLANNLCWKCQEETGTFLHAIWECKCINPFWEKIIEYIGKWVGLTIPVSLRLCLLGDQTELPNISKYDLAVIKLGAVTAARIILRVWKNPALPDFKKWMELMLEAVSYEHMLARINDDVDNFKRSWDRFLACNNVMTL